MGDTTFFLMLIFICYMTGIFTPKTVLQSGIPSKKVRIALYNGLILVMVLVTGLTGFFSRFGQDSLNGDNIPAAFVFFDQLTEDKVAVYRVPTTSFTNHLSLQVQSRTVIDSEHVELGILLTNQLDKPLYVNPNYLHIETEKGQQVLPIKSWVAGEPIVEGFQLEAGEQVFSTFWFPKSSEEIGFELKYLPIGS